MIHSCGASDLQRSWHQSGILSERYVGRTKLIRANDESPLVDPLRTSWSRPAPW